MANDVCRINGRNERGIVSFICELTRTEADSMVAQGRAKKTGRCNYLLVPPVEASTSHESPTMITPSDIYALVGLRKLDPITRERLVGYGLLPMAA